jgi:hypothetical protein
MNISIEITQEKHYCYSQEICDTIEKSAQLRGTGIAKRTPEYIQKKMESGDAMIALDNEKFVGLTFCWDGADLHEFSGKCIWPLCISIVNFPKDLRDKLNIGLHVVSMCSGITYLIMRF